MLVIPNRFYSQRTLWLIIHSCIILHNMIIDDEHVIALSMKTITLSLSSLLHQSTTRHRLASQASTKRHLIEHVWIKYH
jgi:hypothetical protein